MNNYYFVKEKINTQMNPDTFYEWKENYSASSEEINSLNFCLLDGW